MPKPGSIALLLMVTCVATGWAQRSPAGELNIGIIESEEFERRVELLFEPAIEAFVERTGQLLTRNSDATIPLTFRILDSEDINVFVVTGFVYVTTGLLEAAQTEAEFASALAYGVARHSAKQWPPQTGMFFMGARSLFPSALSEPKVLQSLPAAATIQTANTERTLIEQADILAVKILYEAGYDPAAATSFFQTVEVRTVQRKQDLKVQYHPKLDDRIQKIQKWAAKNLPRRDTNAVTTAEFDKIHRRLVDAAR